MESSSSSSEDEEVNLGNNSKIEFIDSQRGHPTLLHAGHKYNFNKTNKNGTSTWRCVARNECCSTITLSEDKETVKRSTVHSCQRNPAQNHIEKIMNSCKKLVCKTFKPVKEVFEDIVLQLNDEAETVIDAMPTYKSKKDTLNRARRNFLRVTKTKFDSLDEVSVPQIIAENFLVYSDGDQNNKILVFSTPLSRRSMENSNDRPTQYFGDGTFKRTPAPFYQFFSLHMDIDSNEETTNIVPVLFSLLPNKCIETYVRLFEVLRHILRIRILHYKCDYEVAQYTAFKMVYPDSILTGCYFHMNKSVWKKGEKLGLTATRQGQEIVRQAANLPLLPTAYINDAFVNILINAVDTPELRQFQNYMSRQWLSCRISISCSNENHRTTNSVESWHRRLNARIRPKPTLIFFLQRLCRESKVNDLRLRRNLFNSNNRKRKDKVFNTRYKEQLKNLEEGRITAHEFLTIMSDIKNNLMI